MPGDLRVAARDPFALRYLAVLAFGIALLFGSIWKVGSVAGIVAPGTGLANGPVWEGWAEPPRYTGKPTLYLNEVDTASLNVPKDSQMTVRLRTIMPV